MCFARFTPFAALLVVFLAFSEVAKAECGDLPKVSWWGDLTHGKIARYVEAKHGGEWETYVKKWEKQHAKLKDIHGRGSAVVVNRHGRFRESGLLRAVFENVMRRCMEAGLVAGEGFAVDASVIEADASRFQRIEGAEVEWSEEQLARRAIKEYVDALESENAPIKRERKVRSY